MTTNTRCWGLAACAVAALAAAGCGGANAGCTAANCQSMLETCQLALDTDPTGYCFEAVVSAGSTLPTNTTATAISECVKACDRSSAGDLVACMSQNAALCASADGGVGAALEVCKSSRVSDASCIAACAATFQGCVLACPATSMDTCLPCGDGCADTYQACKLKCPSSG